MRRTTHTRRIRELEGSDRSVELAQALAMTCDPETLEALLHAKMLLDSVGGQIFMAAQRPKFRETPQGLVPLEDHREPGKYVTVGYVLQYDHIATALRAPREPDSTPDDLPEDEELLAEAGDEQEA